MSGFTLAGRYPRILNLLIGIIIIPYFLALSAIDLVKLHLAANILPMQSEAAPLQHAPARPLGPRSRAYYDTIVRRDVFNLAPAPEAAPVENENLNIKLIGTSQLSSGKPYAIIEDPNGNQILYRVGAQIPSAGQLIEVDPNRAVILHNGHRVALTIPSQGASTGGPALTPMPGEIQRFPRFPLRGGTMPGRPLGGVHRLGANRFVLDRSTVDSNLKNMAPLFTQIRATPNLQNGATNGYRLSEIQPNSIFQQIGLQDGDLLTTVNGQPVGDPAKAMGLLQSLQNQPAITLTVVRSGAPTSLHYNIR